MSLQRPRRIFRGASRATPLLLTSHLAAGLVAAAVVGAVVMVGSTTDLFGRVPPPPTRLGAEAGEVAVIDGATLRLRNRVVRLRGIQVPDRGAECPAGTACGAAAAAGLSGLVRDRRVECRIDGRDEQGRPWATCEANGRDLGAAMVGAGLARAGGVAPR